MKTVAIKLMKNFELYFCQALLVSIVCSIFLDILGRNLFNYSISWVSEFAVYANVYFGYFGACYAARLGLHNRVVFQFRSFSPAVKIIGICVSDAAWVCFNMVFLYYSYDFVVNRMNVFWTSQTLGIPMRYIYIVLPAGFALLTVRIIQADYLFLFRRDRDAVSESPMKVR